MKVYGIKNCDTVKKALTWLDENNVKYEFHDYKKLGVSEDKLKEWSGKVGYEPLINKRGTTWKKLDPAIQSSIDSEHAAFQLMQDKTSVIKRPILENNDQIVLGFDPEAFQKLVK